MLIAGIDPGFEGGITILNPISKDIVRTTPMPLVGEGSLKKIDMFAFCRLIDGLDRVFVEAVHAMPGQGVTSMFKFGYNAGMLEGAISALKVPVHFVTPQAWMKKVLVGYPKIGKPSQVFCARTFPTQDWRAGPRCRVPHDGMTDSCCIAYYGMLQMQNKL